MPDRSPALDPGAVGVSPERIEQIHAQVKLRIHGLVNQGAEICSAFQPRPHDDGGLAAACRGCGYGADVHLLRDLLSALDAQQARIEALETEVAASESQGEGVTAESALVSLPDAAHTNGRICPQDGSVCWDSCVEGYCQGVVDGKAMVERQLAEATAKLAKVETGCGVCNRKHVNDVLRRLRSRCYECRRVDPDDEQTPATAECMRCGELDCPHNEPLHYHHDGCPACTSDDRCGEKSARIPLDRGEALASVTPPPSQEKP